jgi:hypothetical protein
MDDGYGEKRPRLLTDGDLVIVEEVETDVYFKINFERFIIRWRNVVCVWIIGFYSLFFIAVYPLLIPLNSIVHDSKSQTYMSLD